MSDSTLRQIGALWVPQKKSKVVLAGKINFLGQDIDIGIFANEDSKDKEPQYHIVRFLGDKAPAPAPAAGKNLPF